MNTTLTIVLYIVIAVVSIFFGYKKGERKGHIKGFLEGVDSEQEYWIKHLPKETANKVMWSKYSKLIELVTMSDEEFEQSLKVEE